MGRNRGRDYLARGCFSCDVRFCYPGFNTDCMSGKNTSPVLYWQPLIMKDNDKEAKRGRIVGKRICEQRLFCFDTVTV